MGKIFFDLAFSLIGICFSFPLWLLLIVMIKLEDGGSVFYLQERVGEKGRVFKGLKFRSMIPDAEKNIGPVQASVNDFRLTKMGRLLRITAMDELPQLALILRGDMSFVGPRALRSAEIDGPDMKLRSVWEFEGFKERCAVRPGLTGVAQILLSRDAPREVKFKYDIWYIKNQSFWLDIHLILLSFLVTFYGKWESRKEKLPFLTNRLAERVTRDLREEGLLDA